MHNAQHLQSEESFLGAVRALALLLVSSAYSTGWQAYARCSRSPNAELQRARFSERNSRRASAVLRHQSGGAGEHDFCGSRRRDLLRAILAFSTLAGSSKGSFAAVTAVLDPAGAGYKTVKETIDPNKTFDIDALRISAPLRIDEKTGAPYVPLIFPALSTPERLKRGQEGVILEFAINTASNVNVIDDQIAKELNLSIAGNRSGENEFSLGPVLLGTQDYLPVVTQAQTAIAIPDVGGLLGVPFLDSLPGGLELEWGDEFLGTQPSVTFLGTKSLMQEVSSPRAVKVPLQEVSELGLPLVKLRVGTVEIPALLDTGAPYSVVNEAAALKLGLRVDERWRPEGTPRFMKGTDAVNVDLKRSAKPVELSLGKAVFGARDLYIGTLPGMDALSQILDEAGNSTSKALNSSVGTIRLSPVAVVGLDLLKAKRKVIYTRDAVYLL